MKVAKVGSRAVKRVRNQYLWVFADELARKPEKAYPGEIVGVESEDGEWLGVAFYNGGARVALRMLGSGRALPDGGFWRSRLAEAIRRREPLRAHTDALRLVYAEGDLLPGLVVDAYAGHLSVQFRNAGMDGLKLLIVSLLDELLAPPTITERSDVAAREEEGLERVSGPLKGTVPELVEIREHGVRFLVDVAHGQKTGFFTDQRDARRHVAGLLPPGGRMLDAFCYTGGFGVFAAAAGATVTAVDKDAAALGLAGRNAALNGVADRFRTVEADLFAWLDESAGRGERYDVISLDPPALIKHKNQQAKGRGLLMDLVRPCLRMLETGGKLHLSTCAYHFQGDVVREALRMAAADTGRRLLVVGEVLQSSDHPWCLQMPETQYLRGITVEIA